MRNRALRPFATILSLLLAASTTVQAGPISITDVIQVMGSQRNTAQLPDLQLRAGSHNSSQAIDEPSALKSGSRSASERQSSVGVLDSSLGAAPAISDSLLEGIALKSDDTPSNIDVIAQGDLEGSICDCGEIPTVEKHHFPLWPLLFLAAVPLFFIHHHDCDTCPTPTPTPTPSCTDCNPPVPEPTTLLLFGSGLAAVGAGLRRRYARSKLEEAIASEEAN